jgi:hypothetical protein
VVRGQKLEKLLSDHEAQNKSGRISATIVEFLLITFPIFVPSQCLKARNVCELFSFNCGVSHLNEACCIDDVSRGSLSEILTNN